MLRRLVPIYETKSVACGLTFFLSLFLAPISALDAQCKDPLFESHWFGKVGYATRLGGHIQELNSIPTVKTGLTLCMQYNGKASCCSAEFEREQQRFYDYIKRMVLPAKFQRITVHHQSVEDVLNTAAYAAATRVEREQLDLAIERFNPVLNPGVNVPCFSTILTYVAGMTCFACRSDWFAYVTQEEERIVRVHVHPSVCMELWSQCEVFGMHAILLKQSLLDSALAKQAKRQVEDLDMFEDQQALCSWLHNEFALHPFRKPTESEREAAQRSGYQSASERRLAETFGHFSKESADPIADSGFPADIEGQFRFRRLVETYENLGEIDLLAEGRMSDFDTKWFGDSGAEVVMKWHSFVWLPLLAWLLNQS